MKIYFKRTAAVLLFLFLLNAPVFDSTVFCLPFEMVFVQVPASVRVTAGPDGIYLPYQGYVDGCRIVRLGMDGKKPRVAVLTSDFVSARDPAVSFDGREILFAGKKNVTDSWQIWRMNLDGGEKRQITNEPGDCFSPLPIGTLFYLNDETPAPQMTYLSTGHGWRDGLSEIPSLALYASRPDGTVSRRITFNLFSDFNQDVLPNGRLVYSSWRPDRKATQNRGAVVLLAVNNDGTDLMAYAEDVGRDQKKLHQVMPRVSIADNRVYFIESRLDTWLGGGALVSVSQARPLHSRKIIATDKTGYFNSPCPLPVGGLLVSFRDRNKNSEYGIWRVDANTGEKIKPVYAESGFHCIDTQLLLPHPMVRGRSSVVGFRHADTGVFFCLSSYISEVPAMRAISNNVIKQLRVIEGVPFETAKTGPMPPESMRRVLGIAPVEPDGSFHIRVPSQRPITFELLDGKGEVVASQHSWSWVMPGESRGCIGCHEDREMAPPNVLAQALVKPEVVIPPPEKPATSSRLENRIPETAMQCRASHEIMDRHPEFARDDQLLFTRENRQFSESTVNAAGLEFSLARPENTREPRGIVE